MFDNEGVISLMINYAPELELSSKQFIEASGRTLVTSVVS